MLTDGGVLAIQFPSVADAAAAITQGANNLMQTLEDLDARLRPLIETWDGVAKQRYYEQQYAWATAMNDIQQILTEVGVKMQAAYENFLNTEMSNAQLWSGGDFGPAGSPYLP